jgi:hypothetical protein
MKTQLVPALDVTSEVRRVLQVAPSRGPLATAKQKAAELGAKRDTAAAEIAELAKDQDAGRDLPASRAKDLLAGKEVLDTKMSDATWAARRRLAVIEEAMGIQARTIRELRERLSREVNLALRPIRQPLVTRIAAALKELRLAATEETLVLETLTGDEVDMGFIDRLTFAPVGSDCAFDAGWLNGRKFEGYEV